MKNAKQQTQDLSRTTAFFETLLSKQDIKGTEEPIVADAPRGPLVNGTSPAKPEGKARFGDPPAPPPQQPLPDKPEPARVHLTDVGSPSLQRSNTERPKGGSSLSPIRQEANSSQIVKLVEELTSAKQELTTQNARLRDLEEMLQKEREARELAEDVAKQLELATGGLKLNGFHKHGEEGSIVEEAFEPPSDSFNTNGDTDATVVPELSMTRDASSIEASTSLLQQRLELMMVEMNEMKTQMESYKQRAERAEEERDADRKTLAEMVEQIRADSLKQRTASEQRGRSRSSKAETHTGVFTSSSSNRSLSSLAPLLQKAGLRNSQTAELVQHDSSMPVALSQPSSANDMLMYHGSPYASMLGVVLLGMGLMAYINGWQKVER